MEDYQMNELYDYALMMEEIECAKYNAPRCLYTVYRLSLVDDLGIELPF